MINSFIYFYKRVICSEFKLEHEVAGATLLAFGNGAPDIFSSFAAFSQGETASDDLGIGSLLGNFYKKKKKKKINLISIQGGACFVTSIVLGSVIFFSDNTIQVNVALFSRDASFLCLGIVYLYFVCFVSANVFSTVSYFNFFKITNNNCFF